MLLLGFAVAGPPIGYVADRLRRPRLLALGFALGSLATVVTGLARTYDQLLGARVLVGVGSAAFMVIALTLLMDLFPSRVRGRVLAGFFLAMPLGAALELGSGRGLRQLADGVPRGRRAGAAAGPRWPSRCPSRSADGARASTSPGCGSTSRSGPSREDYIDLMVNSSYTYSVFGIAFSSFAIAGLVYWLPTFLTAARG